MIARSVGVLAIALVTGCMIVPPSRTSGGTTTEFRTDGVRTGYRFTTGAHTASATKDESPDFDLGAGYVYERLELDPRARGEHGSYIELGVRLSTREHRRVWVAGRGEVFWTERSETSARRGLSARLSIDRFLGGGEGASKGGKSGGAFYGSGAFEAYLEAGARTTTDDSLAGTLMLGVSVRLPLLFFASSPY